MNAEGEKARAIFENHEFLFLAFIRVDPP